MLFNNINIIKYKSNIIIYVKIQNYFYIVNFNLLYKSLKIIYILSKLFYLVKYINLNVEGRGYKIQKKKQFYNFFFNKSHLLYLYTKYIKINKINKKKFFLKIKSILLNKLLNIKPISIYTKKGIFLLNKNMYIKRGKISN